MTKKFLAALLALGLAGASLTGCSGTSEKADSKETTPAASAAAPTPEDTPVKLEKIRAYVPQTMAFGAPMANFGQEGFLKDWSDNITTDNWDGVEQLKAAITGEEMEVAATPAYVSANLYNKGADIRFVAQVVWGMLYVLGQPGMPVGDWQALKGKKVAIAMPGNMPDLVFSYLLKENGLNRDADLQVLPAQDGQQAMMMLLQGTADYVVLPEHAATVAEMKAKQAGREVVRALNLQDEWAKATGGKSRIPMAGLIMPGKLADEHPALVKAVIAEVKATADKANAGDEATLQKIADKYQLPLPVVKQVIPRLRIDVVPAAEVRAEYEDFLKRLGGEEGKIYGGKLPDDKFYAK